MKEQEAFSQQEQNQKDSSKFTETFNHENNEVAKAQKQIASQETTGVIDQA
ncbi:hypothetical protein [Paenibacillus sp. MMO-58]|uniref:hypothetical protein n=1 Tax=Paenibacillus sp. MMO-58 TaxID=3081290 RepID=UPI003018A7E0